MRVIHYSTQYKKDIRRYANRQDMLDALYEVVKMLEKGEPIPAKYSPHKLKGKLKGCWECHVHSNFLLIWIDEGTGDVWLERIGTHHELFGL
jgi:mRNA interferase YafQ